MNQRRTSEGASERGGDQETCDRDEARNLNSIKMEVGSGYYEVFPNKKLLCVFSS